MSPELDQKVRQIYEEALDVPKPKRARFVDFACADMPEVKLEVTRLLEADESRTPLRTETGSLIPPEAARTFGPRTFTGGVLGGAPPEKINRYVIKSILGKGAMGAVYEAVDPVIGRTVALKVLLQNIVDEEEAKSLEDRLFREASSAGRLTHPGIVTVFDVGKEGNMAFIAMERVEGPTLQQMMDARKLEWQQTLEILRQAAAALDYAHEEGIIHRDIKPANIMLHKGTQAKIADFGIAKVSAMSQLTIAGTILGTPSYMSPEQIQNQTLSGRSDEFSLAVVAFEMLTGKKPFERETLPALLLAIVTGERPSASKIEPTLPADLDEVFQIGLNKSADQRFATCSAFVNALAGALGMDFQARTGSGTGSQPPIPATQGPQRFPAPPPLLPPPPPPALFNPPAGFPAMARTVVNVQAPSSIPQMAPMKQPTPSRTALYSVIGVLVVLAAAAYPVYRYLSPHPAPETKTIEQAKQPANVTPPIADHQPPAEVKTETPAAKDTEGGTVRMPGVDEEKPPAEPEKVPVKAAPAAKSVPAKLPAKAPEKAANKPPPEPARAETAKAETAKVDPARAQQLYEEGLAKHKGQPGSAAIPAFEQAAAAGEPRAMLELGKIYSAGDGVAKDTAKASSWYRKAADAGNTSAMVFLAALYAQGSGVPKDLAEAAKWLRKAAEAGNAVAMDGLGQMYSNGQGVPADAAQAVVWYRKAVENNNAAAMYHLGLLLEAKTPAEAAQLFQRAASAGYAPAKAKAAASSTGGALSVSGINPNRIVENKSQLYRLSGSGFSANTNVTSETFSSIGSRDGQYDHRPTAVAPDGSWLAIYLSLPPQQGRTSIRLAVKNATGAAVLEVPIQR
jgi:serine/threonine protein kinase/TPR repeat protein